ncbi:MAG: RNA 2',3'-cyclic phosphodiesterase [candidate division Zixibacteria bacterium]|nr:RNA 2',3'-cyclic phosphodiesterase [candidate division Zixibacteria bacterium]MBU1469075.1 RNA 2',3'-cyclic phosphodiesterase [candidate division Zixibacteria bacterium]MBU2624651.1 RNA 2',3'-cyclic phosphodiesterase [candidate division Zixibacteria bacterium]
MIRAFVAVNISDDQRAEVGKVIGKLRDYDVRIKWVEVSNLHVTLKFLGDTDEKALPDMYAAIADAVSGIQPFDLSLRNLGCFPNVQRPRVIWVGIDDGYDGLRDLSRDVERAVEPFGFAPEKRKFSGHLTIGRVKDNRNVETLTRDLSKIDFASSSAKVSGFVLHQSVLRPQGPVYTPLKIFELTP